MLMIQYSPQLKAVGLHVMDVNVKVRDPLEQARKTQKGSKFIAVLFLYLCAR